MLKKHQLWLIVSIGKKKKLYPLRLACLVVGCIAARDVYSASDTTTTLLLAGEILEPM